MRRSEFLKKLTLGIGVAVVAPKVIAEKKNPSSTDTNIQRCGYRFTNDGITVGGIFVDKMGNVTIRGCDINGNIFEHDVYYDSINRHGYQYKTV